MGSSIFRSMGNELLTRACPGMAAMAKAKVILPPFESGSKRKLLSFNFHRSTEV